MSEGLTNKNTGIIGWTSNEGEDISVPVKESKDFEYNKIIALNKDGSTTDTGNDGRDGKEANKRAAWNIGNFILGPRDDKTEGSNSDNVGDFDLLDLEVSKSCLNTVYSLNENNALVAKDNIYNTGAGKTVLSKLAEDKKKELFKDGKIKGPDSEDAYTIGNRNVLGLRTPVPSSDVVDSGMGV